MNDFTSVVSKESSDLHISRSRFKMPQTIKTTANEGDLVPFFVKEVLPGDTFSLDTSLLCRMATPVFPVMDNCFFDVAYFYVPNRILWDHWSEFLGENKSAPWSQETVYTVPHIAFDNEWSVTGSDGDVSYGYGPLKGSVMNYLGIPTSVAPHAYVTNPDTMHVDYPWLHVSDLPNRAYRMIWNEFYRDENLQSPVPVYTDDSTRDYKDSRCDNVSSVQDYGGKPLKACKFHDYFTSCLPEPQKGPLVSVSPLNKAFPVFAGVDKSVLGSSVYPLHWAYRTNSGGTTSAWSSASTGSNNFIYKDVSNNTRFQTSDPATSSAYELTPDNLYASLSTFGISISSIREAFAVQRLYEAYARHGTRYREILRGIFGVSVPDSRVQVPEYLGGDRIPVNMDQVLQTSATNNISPQGNTAGYSLTANVQHSFTHSFVEHGLIIGLFVVRVEHTYSQGIDPFWFRTRLFDFYFPQFANLSEQPVYRRNLCVTGVNTLDDEVFGYQEAWADYRTSINRLSGGFSPDCYWYTNHGPAEFIYRNSPLADAWTYADFYPSFHISVADNIITFDGYPVLSAEWISEDNTNVGQTLAVPGSDQFIVDFRLDILATRPLPVWSVPGLIDHH